MRSIQNTDTRTYRQLIGNGFTYTVPPYQRDYSWDIEQWDDLWQDLNYVAETGEEHYMGYIVVQTTDNKHYNIVDGQQRFATLSILALAILKCLEDWIENEQEAKENTMRANAIRSTYIGTLDPVTLLVENKLQLNRNSDNYYRLYLTPLGHLPIRNINASELALRRCFYWFYDKVKKAFGTGEAVASFVNNFDSRLYFTVIEVNDDLNAYTVFETLNARGVQLSSADLLKNYLFSIVDQKGGGNVGNRLQSMELFWEHMTTQLRGMTVEEYLRCYWNSLYPKARKKQLFKIIKKELKDTSQVFELMKGMNEEVEVYMALQEQESVFWGEQQAYQDVIPYLRALRLFRVPQTYSLLLAGYRRLDARQFIKLTKVCMVVAFRYHVIGQLNPNELEAVCNTIALAINTTKKIPYNAFVPIYVDKKTFQQKIANKAFSYKNAKLPRYILAAMEQHLKGQEMDYEHSTYTLEHILPQRVNEEVWSEIEANDYERMMHRLGNMTLLESRKNEQIGNANYEQKKVVYATSNCALTSSIPTHYPVWSVDHITARQRQLAKLAGQIWSIQELENLQ